MGGSSSRRYTSSPDDVADNLHWALTEASFWEDECSAVRVVLSQAMNPEQRRKSISGPLAAKPVTTDPAESPAVVELQDRTDIVMEQVDIVLSREKPLAKKDVSHPKDYPAAHPVHSNLGHRTFGSAATEQIASTASTISATQPPGSVLPKPQVPGHQDQEVVTGGVLGATGNGAGKTTAVLAEASRVTAGTTATVLEGAYDPHNTHTAAPPATDVNDLNVDPSAFSPEQLARQERIELCAKFLFVYGLMTKLEASAQHCFKLKQRSDRLKKALKPRRTKQLEDAAVEAMKSKRETLATALELSLVNFDKAREAVDWLHRDYELSYATYLLSELLTDVKASRNAYQYDTSGAAAQQQANTTPGADTLVDSHKPSRTEADIKHLDALVNTLEQRSHELELALEHNERRTMDIALEFLDSNNDGKLTAQDCPRLPPSHFAVLQASGGVITRKSLSAGLLRLSERIGTSDATIKSLANTPPGHVDQERLRAARTLYFTDRQTLREINNFFHQHFVTSVFASLDERVKQETVDVTALQRDLLKVDAVGRLITNPLKQDTTTTDTAAPPAVAQQGVPIKPINFAAPAPVTASM